jgi:hypothetical protein
MEELVWVLLIESGFNNMICSSERHGKYSSVDSPHIGHSPDADKPVALRTCSVSGKEFRGITVRRSPQKPVTVRTCPL